MRKKVCMVVPSFSARGGIATVVKGYRNSVIEKEYEITYIETYCDGSKRKKIQKAIYSYCYFIYYLIKKNPDIIHIHSSFGASFYRKLPFIWLSSILKKPIINHIHGSEMDKFYISASKIKKKLVENTYNKCQILICLSEELQKKLEKIQLKSEVRLVENFSIFPDKVLKKENKDSVTVLYLGFIIKMKGSFDIPQIISEVVKSIPNINFVIAGSGDDEELKKELEDMNLKNYTTLPGWVDEEEKKELLKTADLFLLPSYSEGMPMSILEAMGYGLPIVASSVGGIPQLIKNNENGLLITPGDIEGFAQAIIMILKNDNLKKDMGLNSHSIAKNKFSKSAHIEKILDIYNKAIKTEDR